MLLKLIKPLRPILPNFLLYGKWFHNLRRSSTPKSLDQGTCLDTNQNSLKSNQVHTNALLVKIYCKLVLQWFHFYCVSHSILNTLMIISALTAGMKIIFSFRKIRKEKSQMRKKKTSNRIRQTEMCVIYYVINWRNVNDFNDEGDVDIYSKTIMCVYVYICMIMIWILMSQ